MLTPGALARLCRARDLLRGTHDRTLTIEEVAKAAALSPFHFIRLFRAVFGETPHCLTLMGTAFAVFEKQETARLSDSDA